MNTDIYFGFFFFHYQIIMTDYIQTHRSEQQQQQCDRTQVILCNSCRSLHNINEAMVCNLSYYRTQNNTQHHKWQNFRHSVGFSVQICLKWNLWKLRWLFFFLVLLSSANRMANSEGNIGKLNSN